MQKSHVSSAKIAEDFYQKLIDSFVLGICFDIHRAIKFKFFNEHEAKLYNECFNKHNFNDIPKSHRAFTDINNNYNMIKNCLCKCNNCNRNITAIRYAPHLEKCLGMGRNSYRLASRKIKRYIENSYSNDEYNDQNQVCSENDYEYLYSNKTDESSISTLSNQSNKMSLQKNIKRKKKYSLISNIPLPTVLENNLDNLAKNCNIEQQPIVKVTKIPTYIMQLPKSLLPIEKYIKNISDIQIGDIAILKCSFLLSNNLIPPHFSDVIKCETNNVFLDKWIGEVLKLRTTNNDCESSEDINLKWLEIVLNEQKLSSLKVPNSFYKLIDSKEIKTYKSKLRNEKRPISSFSISRSAIALLLRNDISKIIPNDVKHFLENCAINS